MFQSVPSGRTRRYYIGRIPKLSTRAGTFQFFTGRGIEHASVQLIDTTLGTFAAKVALYEQNWETVENSDSGLRNCTVGDGIVNVNW